MAVGNSLGVGFLGDASLGAHLYFLLKRQSEMLEVKCKCGHVFDEPVRAKQIVELNGVAMVRCPNCGEPFKVFVVPEEFVNESN